MMHHPLSLADVTRGLTGEHVRDAAVAVEQSRRLSPEQEASWLAAEHQWAVASIATTPLAWRVARLAWRDGRVAHERLERPELAVPSSWIHPELDGSRYTSHAMTAIGAGPSVWPFRFDGVTGVFSAGDAFGWWSHGLVHALIGGAWWPGMTEWELMHVSRLSEAVAALHWYWLAEIGRQHDDAPEFDLTRPNPDADAAYADLESRARNPISRLKNLRSDRSVRIGQNALEIMNYEAFAYRRGMFAGEMVEPKGRYLNLGEACEYARFHLRRLSSSAASRWRDTCMNGDFATSASEFESRAASVLAAILSPAELELSESPPHGLRVLQDLGWRLAHASELDVDKQAIERSLQACGDACVAVRDGSNADDAIRALMGALVVDAPSIGADIVKLGYRPLRDGVDPSREPRTDALIARSWRTHRVVGTACEGVRAAAALAVDAPRNASVIEDLIPAAEVAAAAGAIAYLDEAYLGWLAVAQQFWGPFSASPEQGNRYRYRLARRELPPQDEWSRYEVQINPYVDRQPMPFDARWNADLLERPAGAVGAYEAKAATAVWHCLLGSSPEGPLYIPLTPTMLSVVSKLRSPMRLGDLADEAGSNLAALNAAVASRAVLLFDKPVGPTRSRQPAISGPFGFEMEAVIEPVGPWSDQEQVDAYLNFQARSTLYTESSGALVAHAQVEHVRRVADLAAGTGTTTRALLSVVGPAAEVVAVEPSIKMAEHHSNLVGDSRVELVKGGLRALFGQVAWGGPFDAVVCNSGLWLCGPLPTTLGWLRYSLGPRGTLGFNIPLEYLGEHQMLGDGVGVEVASALHAIQSERFGAPVTRDTTSDLGLGSRQTVNDALRDAGFEEVEWKNWSYDWTVGDYLAWLSMPAVVVSLAPADTPEQAVAVLDELQRRVDLNAPLTWTWAMVRARTPA